MSSLIEMIRNVRTARNMTQKELAAALDITPQYLCDLEQGRRLGSVEVVDRLCVLTNAGNVQRRAWHLAGARAHGWNV